MIDDGFGPASWDAMIRRVHGDSRIDHLLAEIDRLREQVRLLDAECANLKAEMDDWRQMSKRLRAALEAFPWEPDGNGGGAFPAVAAANWARTTRAEALK